MENNSMTLTEINKKHLSEIRDCIRILYDKAENSIYSYQFRICMHEIQYDYENILANHVSDLNDILGRQIKPEELGNYNEINIFDIYMWLDKIVYKINFTENKALIMNWLTQPII
jgi:hypothetical protein